MVRFYHSNAVRCQSLCCISHRMKVLSPRGATLLQCSCSFNVSGTQSRDPFDGSVHPKPFQMVVSTLSLRTENRLNRYNPCTKPTLAQMKKIIYVTGSKLHNNDDNSTQVSGFFNTGKAPKISLPKCLHPRVIHHSYDFNNYRY